MVICLFTFTFKKQPKFTNSDDILRQNVYIYSQLFVCLHFNYIYLLLVSCLCLHLQVPLSVSVVENVCDTATNNLKVRYNKLPEGESKKQNFAVCVKGLDFPTEDLSVRLIEWFELLHLLGANKIFLYNLEVHPNVTKVLNYYEKKGYVDVTPISLPGKELFIYFFRENTLWNVKSVKGAKNS